LGANGYAVFGQVVQGMDVVDRMAEVDTESRDTPAGGRLHNVPVEDIELMNALELSAD
jgi:cyclophilin family peptidyl-prolyl cis-trans isomerase